MSGIEPLLAAEVVPAVAGAAEAATGTEAALAAMQAAEVAAASEAAMASTAMEAANTAAAASNALNPYIVSSAPDVGLLSNAMSSADKAAIFGKAGYGPGMSGFQTSVFDTTLGLTGSPQIASLLAGSERMAANLGANALQQAMRPRQQTSVAAQIRRPQAAMNPVALMIEAQKRKRRPLSLL
jgi:hypothetical protein